MRDGTALPLQLLKANLELQLQVARLLQSNGQHWADLAGRAVGEEVAERDAELRELLRGNDWQALAALPADAFWRQLQQRIGDGQELALTLMSAQETFAGGLAEALQAWQRSTADAFTGSGGDTASEAWGSIAGAWEQMLSAFAVPAPTSGWSVDPAAPGSGDATAPRGAGTPVRNSAGTDASGPRPTRAGTGASAAVARTSTRKPAKKAAGNTAVSRSRPAAKATATQTANGTAKRAAKKSTKKAAKKAAKKTAKNAAKKTAKKAATGQTSATGRSVVGKGAARAASPPAGRGTKGASVKKRTKGVGGAGRSRGG